MIEFDIIMTWQFWLAAAACWAVCEVVKHIPGCPSWLVGVVNLVFGVVFLSLLLGFSGQNIVAGVLCSAMACYAFEFVTKIVQGVSNQ